MFNFQFKFGSLDQISVQGRTEGGGTWRLCRESFLFWLSFPFNAQTKKLYMYKSKEPIFFLSQKKRNSIKKSVVREGKSG